MTLTHTRASFDIMTIDDILSKSLKSIFLFQKRPFYLLLLSIYIERESLIFHVLDYLGFINHLSYMRQQRL